MNIQQTPSFSTLPFSDQIGGRMPFVQSGGFFEMENEIWEDIKGYEGYYQISNYGRVKSLKNSRKLKEGIMKQRIGKTGYFVIGLKSCNNGKAKRQTKKVHRLFAEAFIPNPENKPEVNHIDGDKTNNAIENLEWCTHQENMQHAVDSGLLIQPKGEENGRAKITIEQVLEIKKRLKNGERTSLIAKDFPICDMSIHCIKIGKSWKHVKV